MSDVNAAAAPAAPTAPTPVAPPPTELDLLREQVAALQKLVVAQATPAAPAAPVVTPATHGPVKLLGMAAVSAWWKGVKAAIAAKDYLKWFYDILRGLKALLVFGVTGGLALLSEFETIDLTPLISKFLPAGAHIDTAGAIVIMSVVGVLLRLVTKTPVFQRMLKSVNGSGATDSKVDDPG